MEAAKIEWSSIESVFVIDEAYEDINAPQWVDFFTSSQSHLHLDDDDDDADAWFCRPDCKHPKTADDFLKSTTPTSKLLRSVSVSKLIGLSDWNPNRQPNLKRRGVAPAPIINQVDDIENHNPNHSYSYSYSTPPPSHNPLIHSYSQQPLHGDHNNDAHLVTQNQGFNDPHFQPPFGAGDILAKITDLGSKLKKMASLTRPPFSNHPPLIKKPPPPPPPSASASRSNNRPVLAQRPDFITSSTPNQRKPFTVKDTCQSSPLNSSPYHNPTNSTQIRDDEENAPISLHLKDIKCHQHQNILPIRTNPPTPQGFSATRVPTSSTPSKGPKSRLMKREVLEEMEQDGVLKAEVGEKCSHDEPLIAGKQGRGLDVLWFLKPCTL